MEHSHVLSMGPISLRLQRWEREKEKEKEASICPVTSEFQVLYKFILSYTNSPKDWPFLFPGWLLLFPFKKALKLRESGKIIWGHEVRGWQNQT